MQIITALLSSKVVEEIVANQLISFLETNNLSSKTQHGFRNRLSTETALLQITDEVYNIDNNQINLLTLCELKHIYKKHPYTSKIYIETNGPKLNPHIFLGSLQNIAKMPNDTPIEFESCSIKPKTSVKNLSTF